MKTPLLCHFVAFAIVNVFAISNINAITKCEEAITNNIIGCEQLSAQLSPEISVVELSPASSYHRSPGYNKSAIHLALQILTQEKLSEETAYNTLQPKSWHNKPFPRIAWHYNGYDHSVRKSSYYIVLDFNYNGKSVRTIVEHEVNHSQPGFKQVLRCSQIY